MRCFIKILILVSIFSTSVMAEQTATVTIDRAWGLLLGDEVTVQVELAVPTQNIDPSSLPQIDKRYGTWLYLTGTDLTEQQLLLSYQIVNVPTENTVISTPELTIRQLNGSWIIIPALPLTIGSLLATSEGIEEGSIVAKPDQVPMLIATEKTKQQLMLFSSIMLISSIILVLWHFGWKPKNRQPFAQAVHELSWLKWQRSTDENQASRILHAAFNRSAGTIVVHGELDQILDILPWLMPLKEDIDTFYQQSADHFFSRNSEQEPEIDTVRKLAKACRSKEKLA